MIHLLCKDFGHYMEVLKNFFKFDILKRIQSTNSDFVLYILYVNVWLYTRDLYQKYHGLTKHLLTTKYLKGIYDYNKSTKVQLIFN